MELTESMIIQVLQTELSIEPAFYQMIASLLLTDDSIATVEEYPELITVRGIDQVGLCVWPLLKASKEWNQPNLLSIAGRAEALASVVLPEIRSFFELEREDQERVREQTIRKWLS